MAQVDWLIQEAESLKPGQADVSIVTSGDIDFVYIHLFTLCTGRGMQRTNFVNLCIFYCIILNQKMMLIMQPSCWSSLRLSKTKWLV